MSPARVRPLLPRVLADLGDRIRRSPSAVSEPENAVPLAVESPRRLTRAGQRRCRCARGRGHRAGQDGIAPTCAIRPPAHRRRLLERALVRHRRRDALGVGAALGFLGCIRRLGAHPRQLPASRGAAPDGARPAGRRRRRRAAAIASLDRRPRRSPTPSRTPGASPSSCAGRDESATAERAATRPWWRREVIGGGESRSWHDGGAPLSGIRVLDLTRVIAGPVATRTLALFGADVLRIDSPRLPEIGWQHLDTGAGKRTALLDLAEPADRRPIRGPAADADVVVLGYRPAASGRARTLARRGIAARHPGIVVGRLSAWGSRGRMRSVAASTASCRRHPGSRGSSRRTGSRPARCPRRHSTTRPATCWPPASCRDCDGSGPRAAATWCRSRSPGWPPSC